MKKPLAPPHERLIAKLESIADITAEARSALTALPFRIAAFDKNADIVRQGDRPSECGLIIEGFVCRYKVLGQGQRQIFSIHIAGDIPDLQGLHLKKMDHSLAALTPTVIGFIPHAAMQEITRTHPDVAALFWRDTLIDAAIFREWLAGVGRRNAHQRIAHMICEVHTKMRAVGLAQAESLVLPVTQVDIADSLGLSAVHVNRVLQDLRREGLLDYRGRFVVISNWARLQARGDFDPEYLHLRSDQAA